MINNKNVTIHYIGHSSFLFETNSGQRIIIDPWLIDNPSTNETVESIGKIDFVLITHGHFDHVGDSIEILKANTNAKCIANFEICNWLGTKDIPNVSPMNHGGTQIFDNFSISMVNAIHGSGISDSSKDNLVYGGLAAGMILNFDEKYSIYHAGDTSIFGDMSLIRDLHQPDLTIIPIGDHFTMGAKEAAMATSLINSDSYIPMHYGTFPVLTGSPDEFKTLVESQSKSEVIIMKPGEKI